MKGLMLHCGTNTVDRERLALVKTPDPTETWFPIPHATLLNHVEETLQRNGLKIAKQAHALGHDSNRYFGLLEVQNGHADDDFGLVVGLRNSHDYSFPAGLVVGARVFVCDNLSFSGEIRIARKHTKFIERDLPQLVDTAVGLLGEQRVKQETRFQAYKGTELGDAGAHDLVIQAMDARVLPVTRIPDILDEWRHPKHPEFAESKTVWRLFNSFTEIAKGGNLDRLPRRSQALHGILDTHCGLLTADPKVGLVAPQDAEIVQAV
jgi:hypothetical protein